VTTIITLNSPHKGPAILIDSNVASFYYNTNSFWQRSFKQASTSDDESSVVTATVHPLSSRNLSDVTILSIAGGIRDTLIRSDLCSLNSLVPLSNGLTSFTTGLQNVWLTTDHLASLWCNQLVRKIAILLFNLVDPNTQQVYRTTQTRMDIFRAHFKR
jgi:glycosylphosphatidylinositol deacylase